MLPNAQIPFLNRTLHKYFAQELGLTATLRISDHLVKCMLFLTIMDAFQRLGGWDGHGTVAKMGWPG